MSLIFTKATLKKDFKKIHDYTIDAFSDTPDFNWTLDEIQNEVNAGWELYSVANEEEEVVAALFVQEIGDTLLTKNTGLKINHQGSGYNHEIKEYYEALGRERKLKKIAHYCRIDNFRMYSLNESHGYEKTANVLENGQIVEWIKILK